MENLNCFAFLHAEFSMFTVNGKLSFVRSSTSIKDNIHAVPDTSMLGVNVCYYSARFNGRFIKSSDLDDINVLHKH